MVLLYLSKSGSREVGRGGIRVWDQFLSSFKGSNDWTHLIAANPNDLDNV